MSVKILGTGSFLPEKSVSNDDLSKVMDTSDEWISSRTGIRSRHISIEDTTSTMAVKAAEKALEVAGISAEELDHIFVATLSGDYATPSTACQVQKGIGAVNAVCMDINAACSGFVFGLNTAVAYARAGMGKKMMIIGVETLSKILDWSDRSTCGRVEVLYASVLDTEVDIKDAERIEKLSLIFVQTLYLYVKNAVCIDFDSVLCFHICGKLIFLFLLYIHESLHHIVVATKSFKRFQP